MGGDRPQPYVGQDLFDARGLVNDRDDPHGPPTRRGPQSIVVSYPLLIALMTLVRLARPVGWLALYFRKSLAGLLMMWPVVLSLLRPGRLASGRGQQKTPEPSPCGLMHLAFAGPGQAIG